MALLKLISEISTLTKRRRFAKRTEKINLKSKIFYLETLTKTTEIKFLLLKFKPEFP